MLGQVGRAVFRSLSPAGRAGKLSIFIFHRVLPETDPLRPDEPDISRFERIVRFISRTYTPLTVGEAALRLADGRLPAAAAVISFDDGYADNFEQAAPILARYGVPASFFIATAYLDGGCMWNDRVIEALRVAPAGRFDLEDLGLGSYHLGDDFSRRAACMTLLPRLKYLAQDDREANAHEIAVRAGLVTDPAPMMTSDQLVALRKMGMEIGAHTHTHPILNCIADEQAETEIRSSKSALESLLGEPVSMFAYPNGRPGKDYSFRHVEMVRRAGFTAAVSTEPTIATSKSDLFQLPRFTPWDAGMMRFALRCGLALARADGGLGACLPDS